jgi:hypothetical protein
MRKIFLFAMLIALAGCVSPQESYVAKQCNDSFTFGKLLTNEYAACVARENSKYQCRSYGFKEGTTDFSKCLLQIDTERKFQAQVRQQVRDEVNSNRFIYGDYK